MSYSSYFKIMFLQNDLLKFRLTLQGPQAPIGVEAMNVKLAILQTFLADVSGHGGWKRRRFQCDKDIVK